MKKITDERLKLKNLKNVRIAFLVQTLGILAILGYDLITKGMEGMRENPLWLVFMLTMIVFLYLSMSVSVDNEAAVKSPKKSLYISLTVLVIISLAVIVAVAMTDGFSVLNGLMIGGLVLVCGIAPIIYIYYLRKRNE